MEDGGSTIGVCVLSSCMVKVDDDDGESFERIRKRGPSKRTRNTVAELVTNEESRRALEEASGEIAPVFRERSLQELHERGLLDEIIVQLKSGKEATVFVGRCATGIVAVKLYRDLRLRSFRNDKLYREGRFVGDQRWKRAMDNASKKGLTAHELLWVEEEYKQLLALHGAGVSVPRPLGHAGYAIAMELVGEDTEPAPRLSDITLDADEAASAFAQSIDNLRLIVESGRVHCDYSTFNLLWHRGRVVVIDLPQVVFMHESVNAADLLLRDIASLCHSFRRHGVEASESDVLASIIDAETWRRLTLPEARIGA
jgi:RIO kinase 1